MLEKTRNTFLKYKPIFILTTITLLLFLSGFFDWCWIIASVFVGLFYITCNFNEILCYTLYFNMFSNIGLFYITSLISAFVIIVIKYIISLAKKQENFFALPFGLTTLFVVVFSIICYDTDVAGFEQGVLSIAIFYVFYFAFVYRKQIDVKLCFRYLLGGLIVSFILGYFSTIFSNYNYNIYYFDGIYNRLQLFSFHQNQLAIYCVFLIAYSIYELINKSVKWYVELMIIVLCLLVGILTMSKTFLIMMVGFLGYFFIYLIIKFKWKSMKIILPILLVICLCGLIFNKFLIKIFDRFFIYISDGSFINKITTGRSEIWSEYLKESSSSAEKLLFGHGLFNKNPSSMGPHNVLIFFLYRVGIVGILFIGLIIWSYIKSSKIKIKITYNNMLVFLSYLLICLIETIFSDRLFIFFILGLLLMLPKSETKQVEKVDDGN